MHRPPKPIIKSTTLFPPTSVRKAFTPDNLFQYLESGPIAMESQVKSMRDTLISCTTGLGLNMQRSLGQKDQLVENVEYLEIGRGGKPNQNQNSVVSVSVDVSGNGNNGYDSSGGLARIFGTENSIVKGNNFSGRGFKIRHFGNYRQKPVKQNFIPIKIRNKPLTMLTNGSRPQHQEGGIDLIRLKPYPQTFHLQEIGSKIGWHRLQTHHHWVQGLQFSRWAVIISQSLFYGSILSQTNLLKLKHLAQNLQKQHPSLNIILRVHSDHELPLITKALQDKNLPVTYLIWSRPKYFETINIYNISELALELGLDSYIVLEDFHEVIRNLYYQCQAKVQGEQEKMDYKCRYVYLKFDGLAKCVNFSYKLAIYGSDGELCVEKAGYQDDTEYLYTLEELKQKIRISKIAQKIVPVTVSSRPLSRTGKNGTKEQKDSQLRQKMLQFSKKLHEQSITKQKGRKRQNSVDGPRRNSSGGPSKSSSKVSNKRLQTSVAITGGPSNNSSGNGASKSCHQVVNELLKNNVAINRQINKFREKANQFHQLFHQPHQSHSQSYQQQSITDTIIQQNDHKN